MSNIKRVPAAVNLVLWIHKFRYYYMSCTGKQSTNWNNGAESKRESKEGKKEGGRKLRRKNGWKVGKREGRK